MGASSSVHRSVINTVYDLMSPKNEKLKPPCLRLCWEKETKLALSSTLSCSLVKTWMKRQCFRKSTFYRGFHDMKDLCFLELYACQLCWLESQKNANTKKRRQKNYKNQRDWSECSKTESFKANSETYQHWHLGHFSQHLPCSGQCSKHATSTVPSTNCRRSAYWHVEIRTSYSTSSL